MNGDDDEEEDSYELEMAKSDLEEAVKACRKAGMDINEIANYVMLCS